MGFRTMDNDEMTQFLSRPLVAVLAINDQGWSPHVTPVWFHHRPDTNHFQVMTPSKSKKTRLFRSGSDQLSLSIQTADGPTASYVNMQGTAELLPLSDDLLQAMVTKYLKPEDRAAYLANPPEDSMFTITPRRITTGVIS